MFLCSVGERFGKDPDEIAAWPASRMRLLETDALMRKAQQQIEERARGK